MHTSSPLQVYASRESYSFGSYMISYPFRSMLRNALIYGFIGGNTSCSQGDQFWTMMVYFERSFWLDDFERAIKDTFISIFRYKANCALRFVNWVLWIIWIMYYEFTLYFHGYPYWYALYKKDCISYHIGQHISIMIILARLSTSLINIK